METLTLISPELVVALLVGFIFPLIAILNGNKTRHVVELNPDKKVYVLRYTAVQLIILMFISLVPVFTGAFTLSDLGLTFISDPFWTAGLFIVSFIGMWLFSMMKVSRKDAEKINREHAPILYLTPTNKKEFNTIKMVSFVAGISEEIVYRGFLLVYLQTLMPLVPAVILANLPFALAHLTSTGWRNTAQAFLLALVFTGAILLTGSLWLSILLHILVDLYSSTISYKASGYFTDQGSTDDSEDGTSIESGPWQPDGPTG